MSKGILLHHARVASERAEPSRWLLVLHGILGSGGNFRSVARRLVESCPAWGMILVDLRAHGMSQSAEAPHTLAAAAEDLARLEASLGLPIAGVLGHSFGGKVAIAYGALRRGELEQAWVLDAGPGARPAELGEASTSAIVHMLEELPLPLPSRERFFEIAAEHGLDKGTTEWLAMNVRRADDGFRLRVDLKAIRALITDYFNQDLWPLFEPPGVARETHIVLGGRSLSVPPADKDRYRDVAAKSGGSVRVHDLEKAGHWVHVDDPEGLLALLRAALSG